MEVYAGIDPRLPLRDTPRFAQRIEELGYDGLNVAETIRDGLTVSALALEHTSALTVRTSVTVAFARSPMLVAYQAWDLAAFSGGRFELGLGSQVRANVVDRFSMPWVDPIAQMREYVRSLRAIFVAFQEGQGLRFDGDHYRFSRLQPYFNPGPIEHPDLRIWLGAVRPGMVRLAGEVADGLLTHPTNSTPEFVGDVCVPALRQGARDAGRAAEAVSLVAGHPVITGATDEELDRARERQRENLAFVLSTPAYRLTLEHHGLGHVQERLRALTRAERWDEIGDVVDHEVLELLTTEARYDELPHRLATRFSDRVTGLTLPPPDDESNDRAFARVIEELRAA